MKKSWKRFLFFLLLPLAVGGLASLLTGSAMADFEQMAKPPLSPPGWLFPVVWSVLYLMMGLASYLVATAGAGQAGVRALRVYFLQLAVNFIWPLLFFGAGAYLIAAFWLIFLWMLVLNTLILFFRISKPAGWLLVPYLLWLTFAAYLNIGVAYLN